MAPATRATLGAVDVGAVAKLDALIRDADAGTVARREPVVASRKAVVSENGAAVEIVVVDTRGIVQEGEVWQ